MPPHWANRYHRLVTFAATAVCSLLAVAPASAQRLTGVVVEADGKTPASLVALLVMDSAGNAVARGQSTSSGTFAINVPNAGVFAVRALRVGFRPTLSERIAVSAARPATLRIQLTEQRVVLAPVRVRERGMCGVASNPALIDTWDQARAALLGVTQNDSPSRITFSTLTWTVERDVWPDTATRTTLDASPQLGSVVFRSPPARQLLREGFVRADGDSVEFHAPDAFVLLDPEFASSYCFLLEPSPPNHPEWVGLGVTPALVRPGLVAIDGVLWLTRDGALQRFDYRYVGLARELETAPAGGRVEFLRLPSGEWIVSSWRILMPQAVTQMQRVHALTAREVPVKRLGRVIERGAIVTKVQLEDGQFLMPGQQPLSLTIRSRDGSAQPLTGTSVALPAEGDTWVSNSTAVIDVGPMSPGRHRFVVQTPLMRDVGLAPEATDVTLLPDTTAFRATLYVPSAGDVRRRLCPASPNEAAAIGAILQSSAEGLTSIYVTRAVDGQTPTRRTSVAIDSTGRWHACGVPRGTSLVLIGERNGLSETLTRFRVPRAMDLAVVGSLNVQSLSVAASLPVAATSTGATLVVRVMAARDSSALRDAEAVVDDSLVVRPNAHGELRISELADGAHTLTVRQLGFSPVTQTVALSSAQPRTETVYLERLPPLLAEVKVRGRMVRVPLQFVDVLKRAASGWGTVFTREDIRGVYDLKSLLATQPGVHVSDRRVVFERCEANLSNDPSQSNAKVQVYIDGVRVTMFGTETATPRGKGFDNSRVSGMDDPVSAALRLVNPSEIEFMEVYRGVAQIPVEFLNDACAVIGIWTRAY